MSEEAKLDEFVKGQDECQHANQQKIRGETVPTDWDVVSIDDISEQMGDGGTPSRQSDSGYFGGDITWVVVDDVEFEIEDSKERLTEKGLDNSSATLWPEGSVIVTTGASIGEVGIAKQPTATKQGITGIIPANKINSHFLGRYLEANNATLNRFAQGTTFEEIRPYILRNVEMALAPFPEQRKIATVLYTVDQAIEKTEEIILQLGHTKQGLYQTLFLEGYEQHSQYQSTKYGEIPEGWNVMKLTEITSQIQAGGTPDTDVTEYYGGNIPWVKTGELSQYHVTETEQSITERGLEESATRLFSPKTILVAMYGATTGEVSLLEIEAATNQACCGIVTTDEVAPEFLFHQLNHLSHRLESLSAGSGQQNISKGIIEKFDIIVPPIREQNSILDVLGSVNESIIKNQSKKFQYRRLKRGLMQDLLSGTVRTTDTTIQVPDEIMQYG